MAALTASAKRYLTRLTSPSVAAELVVMTAPFKTVRKSAAYNANDRECVVYDATSASGAVTLPKPLDGTEVLVVLGATANSHTVTVHRHGSEKVNGAASDPAAITAAGGLLRLLADGTDWTIVGKI